MEKAKKHYKANKKTYYLNLRSNDAVITIQPLNNNNHKFEWNIKNIDLSPQARMCITSLSFQDPADGPVPVVIRCPQVQNINSYDTANGINTIIYISNVFPAQVLENWFPLNSQSLDRIELYFSNNIGALNNGIPNTMNFYIQIKIEDYSTEEVDSRLMPTYTRDSRSIVYPMNV